MTASENILPNAKIRRSPARLLAIVCAGFLGLCFAANSQITAPEPQLKSVFLFNFAQFVEWPADAFSSPDAPFVIGVLGKDPFGKYLDEILEGESIGKHKFAPVKRCRNIEEAKSCHILFVADSESSRLRYILNQIKGHPVLTVGDMEDFALNGGMIRFMTEKEKIRLRINNDSAKAANLVISSKLLRAAENVTTTK